MARTVLVVDDDPLVLDVTAEMLQDLGCNVVTAASGAEALAKLADHRHIAILITDVNMPEMNGHELVAGKARTSKTQRLFSCQG